MPGSLQILVCSFFVFGSFSLRDFLYNGLRFQDKTDKTFKKCK